MGTKERRASGEPQREQEVGKIVQATASRGLRSTRDTARHLEISDSGTSIACERESLLKTHLTWAAVATPPRYLSILSRQILFNSSDEAQCLPVSS